MLLEKRSLFPTNFASFKYEGHESFKEKWNEFKVGKDFTSMDHKSRYNIWLRHPEVFDEIADFFKKCSLEYLKQFYDYEPDIEKLYLDQGWINTITPNNYLNVHCHMGKYLAATYYMETPENCGNLVLVDPRSNGEWLKAPYITNGRVEFKPEEGMVVIFPGWVMHYIDINKSNLNRVSLTTNVCLKDKKKLK